MKKFMKVCAGIALVFLIFGLVFGILGGSVAGRSTIKQVVETVTGGRVHVNMGSWRNWGITVGDGLFRSIFGDSDDIVDYDVEDASMFDRNHNVMSGKVEKYCPGSNIHSLEVEVGGCYFETRTSEDDSVYLEAEKASKLQGYVENGTLYIKATDNVIHWSGTNGCRITLYLPEGYRFDEVELEMGAGEMRFQELYAREASLEVGAGQITVDGIQAQDVEISVGAGQIELKSMDIAVLEAEIGMGEFVADGAINSSADVECSMGNVEMRIDGEERDFNYRLSGSMGNIDLGRESYGGFSKEINLHNGAAKEMEVECSMGNISISFRN